MSVCITKYDAICNLGNSINEIYINAIKGVSDCFETSDTVLGNQNTRLARIKSQLPNIDNEFFNTRCNQLILKVLELVKDKINAIIQNYGKDNIAIVVATTNSGVEEFEHTNQICHSELGNPALFIKKHLDLNNYYATVSTACSSGIKAFSIARNLLNSEYSKAAIIIGVDSITKVPLYGFRSLEILSSKQTNPFGKEKTGINIGEAVSVFVLEKDKKGIMVMGIGETSDIYHATTPNPEAYEAKEAIKKALLDAKLSPMDIDYINLHGTGTFANDLSEAKAVFDIFGTGVPVSSTKPLTGHCLGAAAGIETALCCALLDNFNKKLFPHIYNGNFDDGLAPIKLVTPQEEFKHCKTCMCNSFGFGGTNAIMILRGNK
ncbi:MAG: hypothetical protein LUG16_07265 [Candidatus Gastranaerophilales bacterium]|nr:hypothetical protein [Candidatus Gastranaerophilales bacterium]